MLNKENCCEPEANLGYIVRLCLLKKILITEAQKAIVGMCYHIWKLFNKRDLSYFMCVNVLMHAYAIHTCRACAGQKRTEDLLGIGLIGGCGMLCRCWELNLGPS